MIQRMRANNYQGTLYTASNMLKVMIVITGSDGGGKWANEIAGVFAAQGVPSFALSYWDGALLPKTLSLIPLEMIQSAAVWLKEQGYQKIGIYGISKGAELALTAASFFPVVEFIVAVSPACCVFEGIAKPQYSGASSWTWKNMPLPFASFKNTKVNMLKNIVKTHQFGFTPQYLKVLASEKNESNTIKVENINGPILLLAAEQDAQWPSAKMGKLIIERLKSKHFLFPFRLELFHPASHILCPVKTVQRFAYRMERNHPFECNAARKRALELTIDWLLRL